MKGIEVITEEESYTSRASFLNLDFIPNYGDERAKNIKFSGYRESRGMYKIKGQKAVRPRVGERGQTPRNLHLRSSTRRVSARECCPSKGTRTKITRINADVNGSYNILRKVIPTAFSQGIEKAARWAGSPT